MDRVNISIPEDLHRRAKEAGLNISKLTRDAIIQELERLAKIAAFDKYLAELEAELGSPTDEQVAEAKAWADEAFGRAKADRRSA
jgi:post-segregation antitoxin (ccd killing protein)